METTPVTMSDAGVKPQDRLNIIADYFPEEAVKPEFEGVLIKHRDFLKAFAVKYKDKTALAMLNQIRKGVTKRREL